MHSYYFKRPINSLPSNHRPKPNKFILTFESPLKRLRGTGGYFPSNLGCHDIIATVMLVSQNYSQKAEFFPFEKKKKQIVKKATTTNKAPNDVFSIYNGVVLSFDIRSSAPSLDHFRITFGLFFKASLGAHPFI